MNLQSRMCGCGQVFRLATLMSRETRCPACDRKRAVEMNAARDAERVKAAEVVTTRKLFSGVDFAKDRAEVGRRFYVDMVKHQAARGFITPSQAEQLLARASVPEAPKPPQPFDRAEAKATYEERLKRVAARLSGEPD